MAVVLSKKPLLYATSGGIIIVLGLFVAPDALAVTRVLYYAVGFLFLSLGGGLWVRSSVDQAPRPTGLWRLLFATFLAILLPYMIRSLAPLYLTEWLLISLSCDACLYVAVFLKPFTGHWRHQDAALLVALALMVISAITSINGHVWSLAPNSAAKAQRIALFDWHDVYSMEGVLSPDPSGDIVFIRTRRRGGGDLYFTLDVATGEVTQGPDSVPSGLTQVATPLFFLRSRAVVSLVWLPWQCHMRMIQSTCSFWSRNGSHPGAPAISCSAIISGWPTGL